MTSHEPGTPTEDQLLVNQKETAALRAQVPDFPVRLPDSRLACDCCGVAVTVTWNDQIRQAERLPPREGARVPNAVLLTRCPPCEAVTKEAAAYLAERPHLVVRMGNIVQERVEQALFALRVLELPRPSPEVFDEVWPLLWRAASMFRWGSPVTVVPGHGSSRPWAHLSEQQRQRLRDAYAQGVQQDEARSKPPVTLGCPSEACLFCGVTHIVVPALEVARLGGATTGSRALWHRVVTNPAALGGAGPDKVSGHLCPACTKALQSVGGVGQTAREHAVVNHVQATLGDDQARRLRERIADDCPPPLPAWAAVERDPNARPWGHLGSLLGRP